LRRHLMAYRLPDRVVVGIVGVASTPSAAFRGCLRRVAPMPEPSGQPPDLEKVIGSLDELTPVERAGVEADWAAGWLTDSSEAEGD
jgi:hypothetical protein